MSYTKGPWNAYPFADQWIVQRGNSGGFAVKDENIVRAEADAHLIAAAPDLLEACKEWVAIDGAEVGLAEGLLRWNGMVSKMEAAIARAEGRS
jgi:hypothetical protein